MIALGKYKAKINNMFFKGDAIFELEKEGDAYEMEIELQGADFDMPDFKLSNTREEGDTFYANATTSLLPGKEIDVELTFEDGKCNGFLKIPFIGKIKIKDAEKIA